MIYTNIIIGAGIAGSLVSRKLQQENINHLLIDKGRSVGGRFSNKRFDDIYFNHGIQALDRGDFENAEWFKHIVELKLVELVDSKWQILVPANLIIKNIVDEKNVILSEEIETISFNRDHFTLTAKSKKSWQAKKLICTAPAAQSLKLFKIFLSESEIQLLNSIQYSKKLILFINNIGLKSGELFEVVTKRNFSMITFNDEISEKYFELEESEIKNTLLALLNLDLECELKKWRYAKPLATTQQSPLLCFNEKILFCGDGFKNYLSTLNSNAANSF